MCMIPRVTSAAGRDQRECRSSHERGRFLTLSWTSLTAPVASFTLSSTLSTTSARDATSHCLSRRPPRC